MNEKHRLRSSGIFLLELILSILFFAIASTVCVQLFVKAHTLSNKAELLSHAVSECTSASELLATADSLGEYETQFAIVYPTAEISRDGNTSICRVYYDSKYKETSDGNEQRYLMLVHVSEEGSMLIESAVMEDMNGQTVFTLANEHHVACGTEVGS